jgi:hypothetical protein
MNIDPEAAAESYRTRVLQQLGPAATPEERSTVREQLSGACTTEIAAFDEFVGLLDGDRAGFAGERLAAGFGVTGAAIAQHGEIAPALDKVEILAVGEGSADNDNTEDGCKGRFHRHLR